MAVNFQFLWHNEVVVMSIVADDRHFCGAQWSPHSTRFLHPHECSHHNLQFKHYKQHHNCLLWELWWESL